MPDYYSYKIVRDYGFAPNPFHGICTLATCKPHVRLKANIGDWIIGSGAKTTKLEGRVIYIMLISDKVSFEEYSQNKKYFPKKPITPGGLKRIHGDNIYFKGENNIWNQLPSQHSNPDFSANIKHMKNDLSGKYVLISDYFFYFGNNHFLPPHEYKQVCSDIRDYRKIKNKPMAESFIRFVEKNYQLGVIGDPINWIEYYQRSLF
ncbi:Nmad2 family putative nucleotide modification protein [Flavitalea flava]